MGNAGSYADIVAYPSHTQNKFEQQLLGVIPWAHQTNPSKSSTCDFPRHQIITLGRYYSSPSVHLPSPSALAPAPTTLTKMATHLDQVHGIHLFCNHIFPLVPGVKEIGIEIAKKKRLTSLRAFQPGLLDVCQHSAKIGGWDIRSHYKIPNLTHHQLKSRHIEAAWHHFLNLLEFIIPPEEGDPSLTCTDCIGGHDVVSTRISSVNAVSDLGLREDPQIHLRCCHCPQGTLQTSISAAADVIRRNQKGPATISS